MTLRPPASKSDVLKGTLDMLAITTVAATWVPARRATRLPLVDTLRAE